MELGRLEIQRGQRERRLARLALVARRAGPPGKAVRAAGEGVRDGIALSVRSFYPGRPVGSPGWTASCSPCSPRTPAVAQSCW